MNTLWIILKFLPEIFAFIKWLDQKIKDGIEESEIRNSLKDFTSALDKALKTKDTTDLEDIFRGKKS